MAVDRKYGQVTTERGNIGEDEPVVVFRGQDALLPLILAIYRELCKSFDSPETHIELIENDIAVINDWQSNNYQQVPKSDG